MLMVKAGPSFTCTHSTIHTGWKVLVSEVNVPDEIYPLKWVSGMGFMMGEIMI